MDVYSRKILAWRLSNTPDAHFCTEALAEAIAAFGTPEIFNTDQGSQTGFNRSSQRSSSGTRAVLRGASRGVRQLSFLRGRALRVAASNNWDAACVFVKYRVSGGAWRHPTLAPSGHIRPAGVEVDVPSDRVGAFVYRSSSGYGTFTANGVGLQWDYVADGVAAGASVDVVLGSGGGGQTKSLLPSSGPQEMTTI